MTPELTLYILGEQLEFTFSHIFTAELEVLVQTDVDATFIMYSRLSSISDAGAIVEEIIAVLNHEITIFAINVEPPGKTMIAYQIDKHPEKPRILRSLSSGEILNKITSEQIVREVAQDLEIMVRDIYLCPTARR